MKKTNSKASGKDMNVKRKIEAHIKMCENPKWGGLSKKEKIEKEKCEREAYAAYIEMFSDVATAFKHLSKELIMRQYVVNKKPKLLQNLACIETLRRALKISGYNIED